MASKGAIDAGQGTVGLGVDDSKLVKGLRKAEGDFKSWGSNIATVGASITAAGALITGPFIGALHIFADLGSAMLDMSQRTGVGVEALSELAYAAEQSGSSAEGLETAFKGMAKLISGAAGGDTGASETLRDLGLSVQELNGITQEARFELLADKLSQIEDPSQRAAAAMKVFGKAGIGMLPLFEDGAKGIKALREEANRLGVSMSTEDAKAAEALGDQISTVTKQFKMMAFHVGASIAPLAKDFLGAVIDIAAQTIAWIRANGALLSLIFKIGAGLVVAGTAITILGGVVYGTGMAFGFLASAISFVSATIGVLVGVLSFIGLPILLAVAAFALLIAFFPEFRAEAANAFGAVAEYMSEWVPILQDFAATFMQVWDGIWNAISGGDLGLAMEIAWLGLQLVWVRGINWIRGAWFDLKYMAIATMGEMFNSILDIYMGMVKGIARAFVWVGARIIESINSMLSAIPNWVFDLIGVERIAIAPINEAEMNQRIDANAATMRGELAAPDERAAAAARAAEAARARGEEADIQDQLDNATILAEYEAWYANADRARRAASRNENTEGEGKGSIVGTFSAAAIAGMAGGGNPLLESNRRQEARQEEIRDAVLRIQGVRLA